LAAQANASETDTSPLIRKIRERRGYITHFYYTLKQAALPCIQAMDGSQEGADDDDHLTPNP
jgi:hypothetical protein